jgi:hypothetical protein
MESFLERLFNETGAVDLAQPVMALLDHWLAVPAVVLLGLAVSGVAFLLVRRAEKLHKRTRESG